ncbi:mannan endo-1,4-beta-mannosidase 7-like [Arachis hypogaea]|nr:mannan endo-1,4-beta-mannosidase 7-like isoform X1 [Arachis hypogaea]XP_025660621.1 mannan endo-1,4-beta-mannosidase 7-like isoform X1 [Arachis hypogaea]QHN88276.1 Mannan endo-1,4-beta-mannosidase [Arachis hypogaea]
MKHRLFFMPFSIIVCIMMILIVEADNNNDGFVKARGIQLVLNGNPYYANGFNAYWLMFEASEPSQRNKVSSAFQDASSLGLNIARTWAFSDGGYKPLQYSPGSYNEDMFQGLDFVISEAKKYGMKLVLSLVNNYEDMGGKKQYVEWGRSQGQSINSEDDFYTNPVVKGYYKNHIKGWIEEMASYVKSIDGNHLLEAGLEGFYGQSKQETNPSFQAGTDFIANNQIPEIDFATVHSYPDQWLSGSSYEDQISFLSHWLNEHIQDAQNTLHKPVLFAEFGISTKTFGSNTKPRDQFYNTVYSKIYSSASGGGAAVGCLFWQLLDQGMDTFRDGYEVVISESPSTASLIAQESQKMNRIRKKY